LARAALLVIDMQHDFVDKTGAVPCDGAFAVIPTIKTLIAEAHQAAVPVIFTREEHRAGKVDFGRELDGDEGFHCVEGTQGVEIVQELAPEEPDYVIAKRRYSAFFGTDLNVLLKGLGVDTLFLTGAATDVCVYATAIDAHQYDFFVRVIRDCVAGTSRAAHEAALAAIERLQHGAVTVSSKAIESFRQKPK